MKKRITIISLILSIFLLLGCNSQEKQEEVNLINDNEIALNYLTIKSGIGNYIAQTSFSENETGEINKNSYDDTIRALESLNIIIKMIKIFHQKLKMN